MTELEYDERPWGNYQVLLDTGDCKVKRIVVHSGCRNSYQRHEKRGEQWIIVSGFGEFTLNDKLISGKAGDVIEVLQGMKHRFQNPGKEDLVLIEVQLGTYFGEDDIERFEDDYGREGTKETCIDVGLVH